MFSWVSSENVLVVLVVYDEYKTRLLVVVKYFLCVGNFGFTTGRPIQDYGSGPGTRVGGRA